VARADSVRSVRRENETTIGSCIRWTSAKGSESRLEPGLSHCHGAYVLTRIPSCVGHRGQHGARQRVPDRRGLSRGQTGTAPPDGGTRHAVGCSRLFFSDREG
jgi:hypothetical protein